MTPDVHRYLYDAEYHAEVYALGFLLLYAFRPDLWMKHRRAGKWGAQMVAKVYG